MEHEANKAIVRRLYEQAFNHTGDLSVIEEFVASDFSDHAAPPGLPPGREGFRQAVLAWRHAGSGGPFDDRWLGFPGPKLRMRWVDANRLGNWMSHL